MIVENTYTATILNGEGTLELTFTATTPGEVIEQIWDRHGLTPHIVSITENIAEPLIHLGPAENFLGEVPNAN